MMDEEGAIRAILSTRLLDESRLNLSLYKHFPKEIELFCRDTFLEPPKLVITFSSSRNCEIIRVGNQKFIIYDQYYGQSLNQLNTIAVTTKNREDLLVNYGQKVLAEELRIQGKGKRALFHALRYAALRAVAQNQLNDARLHSMKRQFYIPIQEVYVLAHELAHDLIGYNNMLRSRLVDENLNHINLTIWSNEEMINGLGKELGLSEGFDNEEFLFSNEEKEALASEMACDDIALSFSLGFSQALGADPFISLEAIWLGQLNMWWLSSLARAASQFGDSNTQDFLLFNKGLRSFRIRHDKMVAEGFKFAFGLFPQNTSQAWVKTDQVYRSLLDNQYKDYLNSLTLLQRYLLHEKSNFLIDTLLPALLEKSGLSLNILETQEWMSVVDRATGWRK